MKRAFLFFLVLTLTSCDSEIHEKSHTHHLYQDFTYAEMANYVRAKDPAFAFSFEAVRGAKRYPTLVQNQPGAISFYVQLKKDPVISFSIDFQARKKSELDTRVVIESDNPVLRKEFSVRPTRAHSLRLEEFQGKIVRITFEAKSRNLIGLGGLLFWIDPAILQRQEPVLSVNAERLRSFRNKHRNNNVVLFLFDATNPTHLGCYGYPKPTSPVIDSVAADGLIWENAIAQAVSTLPSTGSLLTGLYPEAHGMLIKRSVLPSSFKTMAEHFREAGFRTALFSANPNASPLSGYDQGFEDVWSLRQGRSVSANEFVVPFNDWITQVHSQRFFAYLHIREPHWPYKPPAEFLARFYDGPPFQLQELDPFVVPPAGEQQKIIASYDANLAFADAQLGKMLDHMRSLNVLDNTIIVILADHGEAFWQHGKQGHNHFVNEDTARIPLIIRFPDEPEWKGQREPAVVGSIDLLPTFADTFLFSRKGASFHGQSLLPFLLGKTIPAGRFRLTQTSSQSLYAIRSDQFKYILHNRDPRSQDEFFHLYSDPDEQKNVIRDYPISSTYYRVQLQKTLKELKAARKSESKQEAVIDKETEEELKALGYVN